MNVHVWVLVLAGGDGRRLHGISRDRDGREVPKQYSDFGTGRSLIARALDRALALAPHSRVVAVVAEAHRQWWGRELDALPPENIVAQPGNRGTAAGILLPLLHIASRDPGATVVVLPSDHHVADEETLVHAVAESIEALARHPERVILLGMTPEHPDTEYGWVLPDVSDGSITHPVAAFVEKPAHADAIRLMAMGAVWNSFMFAGHVATLIGMFRERLPGLLAELRGLVERGADPAGVEACYAALDARDFSRDVLQALPDRLRVLAVSPCGWTDLGTPERLARALQPLGAGADFVATPRASDPARAQSAA